MFGIKDRLKWLTKPDEVLKSVLSKPNRRTHPYIYFGYSPNKCIDTGDYVLGNVIETDYAQHDPQQSFSTIKILDTEVAITIRAALLSMFPDLINVPPGSLHLNNLMSAIKNKSELSCSRDGAWSVENPKNISEPIIIYKPALTKHFMDRFTTSALSARDMILRSDCAFSYSEFDGITQSGRMTLHTVPSHASVAVRSLAKKMTCASFVGFDLISPKVNKHAFPEFVVMSTGDSTYTTGSRYIEPGIEITMARPYNTIFSWSPR